MNVAATRSVRLSFVDASVLLSCTWYAATSRAPLDRFAEGDFKALHTWAWKYTRNETDDMADILQ